MNRTQCSGDVPAGPKAGPLHPPETACAPCLGTGGLLHLHSALSALLGDMLVTHSEGPRGHVPSFGSFSGLSLSFLAQLPKPSGITWSLWRVSITYVPPRDTGIHLSKRVRCLFSLSNSQFLFSTVHILHPKCVSTNDDHGPSRPASLRAQSQSTHSAVSEFLTRNMKQLTQSQDSKFKYTSILCIFWVKYILKVNKIEKAQITHLWIPFNFIVRGFHSTNDKLHSLRGQSVETFWEVKQLVSCDEFGPAFIYELHKDIIQGPRVLLLAHLQHLNPTGQQWPQSNTETQREIIVAPASSLEANHTKVPSTARLYSILEIK